jgi:hypothetical protein
MERRQMQPTFLVDTIAWNVALFVCVPVVAAMAVTSPSFPWTPSQVTLYGVSQRYPGSFWRKITSSVPHREWALENVTLTFDSNYLYLLTGDSSAGKSTLLRMIAGTEEPVAGRLRYSSTTGHNESDPHQSSEYDHNPDKPIYMDTRPSYRELESIADIWAGRKGRRSHEDHAHHQEILADLLQLPLNSKVSDLSTSQVYLCRLGEACLDYCSSFLVDDGERGNHAHSTECTTTGTDTASTILPGPIVLLDEWLDAESTTVIQNVQKGLQALVDAGVVVICVTHKPERFERNSRICHIMLSRGKVVSHTCCER